MRREGRWVIRLSCLDCPATGLVIVEGTNMDAARKGAQWRDLHHPKPPAHRTIRTAVREATSQDVLAATSGTPPWTPYSPAGVLKAT